MLMRIIFNNLWRQEVLFLGWSTLLSDFQFCRPDIQNLYSIFSTASIFESRSVSNGVYVSVFSFSKNIISIFLTPHLQNLTHHFAFIPNTA